MIPPNSLVTSQGWGLIDLPLRAAFSPAHPLADIFHPPYPPIASQSISRDVPLAQARAFLCFLLFPQGSRQTVHHCAHRTSTVSSCAFCEHNGWSDDSPLPLLRPRVPGVQDQRGCPSHPSKLTRVRCSRIARMSPPLRASNEGSPRPRVARAQGTHRAIPPFPATG
jgi:hypothetical protein